MKIKKIDDELQVVFGEVYAPNVPDVDGDFMSPQGIQRMAHGFLGAGNVNKIDLQHDNNEVDAAVVESFLAREGDSDFIPGSWVVGIHVGDSEIWAKVKSGKLNGFSMEALVVKTPKVIELELPVPITGATSKSEDHEHLFEVDFSDEGVFLGGRTTINAGHYHKITKGVVTETTDGHAHRYSIVEFINGYPDD